MKVLDLFSGIGGFSLGLERAGMKTIAFCEIDPDCRHWLRDNWPNVPIHEDIRELDGRDYTGIDVVCGGFPCQDISVAKTHGQGIRGEKSGLFFELARIIRESRPRYAIMENVPALLARGMGDVLAELASFGYDAWWDCIPVEAVGAPHQRDRIWIIAYPNGGREGTNWRAEKCATQVAANLADLNRNRFETTHEIFEWGFSTWGRYWSETQRPVSTLDDGVSFDVAETRATGNAVVPQVVEIIGRAIMEVA